MRSKSTLGLIQKLKGKGIKTKTWTSIKSGKRREGSFLNKGQLYQLLHRRVYIGEAAHKDKSYPGEHQAIIDRDMFNKVQEKLNRQNPKAYCNQHSEQGLLKGMVFDGWIGTDENKLWLKSEGERSDGHLEDAEVWALYSRNVSTFWDVQAGLRHDFQPTSTTYAVVGVNGLAPYFFETEAHFFVSDEGDVSARLRQENDFLLTQKLILQPYAEINLYAQDVPESDIGAGFSNGEIGLQTRYEITRKFAPYADIRYERKFGETSSIAKDNGEDNDSLIGSIGVKFMF